MITLVVLGIPIPWAAPTFSRGRTYDIRQKDKEAITGALKEQIKPHFNFPLLTACKLDLFFEMPIPKYWSKKKRLAFDVEWEQKNNVWHYKKPDRSNLVKLYEDCLEKAGVLSNDSLIVKGDSQKYYSPTPRTIILIQPLEDLCP